MKTLIKIAQFFASLIMIGIPVWLAIMLGEYLFDLNLMKFEDDYDKTLIQNTFNIVSLFIFANGFYTLFPILKKYKNIANYCMAMAIGFYPAQFSFTLFMDNKLIITIPLVLISIFYIVMYSSKRESLFVY